jgi:acyl-homoserine-lactone acylase
MNRFSRSRKGLVLAVLMVGTACVLPSPPGSEETTEILWDTWGVPHVFAGDTEGLFRAYGWAQMRSHGDLILELYGRARGRAAEYWGEEWLDSDRWVRTMGIPERARQWYEDQPPTFRASLDAFAEGMNRYADEHGDALSEHARRALPIDAVDVLAHVQRVIHFSFVGRPQAADQARQLVAGEGSNAWAIGPSRSSTGRSLLLINPHLAWSGQQLFYEVHLTGPGIDCYGATLVGFPVVILGFNRNLGWSHTVNTFDGADSYRLSLDGGGYRYDGEVRAFESEELALLVRQDDGTLREEPLVVRRSIHGPVIALGSDTAVAYRVVGLDAPGMLEQWWDMSRAANLWEFEAALARLQVPVFNVIYADREGHILYVFNGRVPRRNGGTFFDYLGMVPGDRSETLWTEVLRYDELPRVLDPPSGWVHNANDPPWTSTHPPVLDPTDFPTYIAPRFMHFRAQQSASLLANDEQITFEELVRYKHWTGMLVAERLVDQLVETTRRHENEMVRRAAEVLAAWDRNADADSRGAVLFERWAQRMNFASIAFPFSEESRQLESEVFEQPWDPRRPFSTPAVLRDPAHAAEVLAAAAQEVLDEHGDLSVAWGEVHRLDLHGVDLPANGGPGDPTGLFHTVWFSPGPEGLLEAVGGDSFYATVEFSEPMRARVLLPYGNSTQPGSAHLRDQIALFSDMEMRVPWLTRAEVESHLELRESF